MIGVVMHLYGYKFAEWKRAVYSNILEATRSLIELHRLALKYDLPWLAAEVSASFDRLINLLFEERDQSLTATISDQTLIIAKALYGTPDNEHSLLVPGFLRAMRTHWANLIEFRKDVITAVFEEHPRLALDLLMSDPKQVRWSA